MKCEKCGQIRLSEFTLSFHMSQDLPYFVICKTCGNPNRLSLVSEPNLLDFINLIDNE